MNRLTIADRIKVIEEVQEALSYKVYGEVEARIVDEGLFIRITRAILNQDYYYYEITLPLRDVITLIERYGVNTLVKDIVKDYASYNRKYFIKED